ncbi:MAG: LysM peptidoglycan-binding domain-containing protein [Bdellovibrionota bacterium]
MSFPYSRFSIQAVTLAAILAAGSSCSSSHPSGDAASGNPDGAVESGKSDADQVGSVPEDMLNDEKGVEASGTAANPEATAADPFGDLKEKENPKEATTVADDEKTLSEPGSSAGSGKMEKYTVKAGDTLMKIAFNIYGDVDRWKDLHELNQEALKSGSALRKGMKLRYEAPVEAFSPEQLSHSYVIKKGDTLAGIADDVYGKKMKYKKLQAYNKKLIKNPNKIFAGFTIFYDITEQEMADAEARRAQKAAGGGTAPSSAPAQPSTVPSAISPPPPAPAPNVAVTPQASDNSAVPGPGSPSAGPPAPTPQ